VINLERLERVLEEEIKDLELEVEEIDIDLGGNFEEKRKFKPWNYPEKPSARCKAIIENCHEIARTIGLDGPSQEYRVGYQWIDICFHLWNGKRFAIEIDDEHHFDEVNFPDQKLKDKRKNKTLEKEGWKVKRIPYTECDRMGPEKTAWSIITWMMDEDLGLRKN
jgi:hypothetical protein